MRTRKTGPDDIPALKALWKQAFGDTDAEIDSFFHISIDKMMMIDDVSLCTIFANTLDNAVEACQKIEDKAARRISVKARYTENGYFSYEIVNSKCNRIRMRRERFITDKADSASHGVGISSVKELSS